MRTAELPTHKDVRDLLAARTCRGVTLATGVPYVPAPSEPATFAVYVDRRMRTLAVVACDLELSVLAAAAIATIPVGGTEAELAQGVLEPTSRQHLHDLLEALTPLVQGGGDAEVRLHAVYPPGVEPPTDIPAYAAVLGRRLDLEVTIAAYGTGRLSLVRPLL